MFGLVKKRSRVVLKTIGIEELEKGMFVESIAMQQGNMKITSRGKVTNDKQISSLKNQGIIALVIDLSKQDSIPDFASDSPPEIIAKPPAEITFEQEIAIAATLHTKGKAIQKRMFDSVVKGLPLDLAIPEEFTGNLVSSIDRNPNALLCMTKIREKDSYLLEHSLNVAILLANFANHVELSEDQVQELALSGFLHDIGKIKIPDSILHKPGKLTDQEMNIMRDHVYFGVKILNELELPESMVRTISEHHERLDGYGYPEGARGDEISLFGRMIAIVDTYDAITAERCYKAGMPSQKALQIILQDSPDKYDLELVKKFIKCIGVYPVGSLVRLNNEKIAMVIKQHPVHSTKPLVKVFYSVRGNHYLKPIELDLSKSNQIKIEKAIVASEYRLDFNKYFSESIAI
jgi:putative nucleotidyltransferase with HDIG domain